MLAALGAALVFAGRTAAGLAAFDRAMGLAGRRPGGRVRYRRGFCAVDLAGIRRPWTTSATRSACSERADDPVWMARALNGRGLAYLAVGSPGRADADFVAAGPPVGPGPARRWKRSIRC